MGWEEREVRLKKGGEEEKEGKERRTGKRHRRADLKTNIIKWEIF